jgi:hypothetical protein
MLSEGIRRHSRGEDVVIVVVETHGRAGIEELATKLEKIPRKKIPYLGATFEEMDLDAILARKPQVVLIDELAHTNIDGSKYGKRYQDVMDLLDANIDALSTMNVQHIESLLPRVLNITGVQAREAVPDWVMQKVNELGRHRERTGHNSHDAGKQNSDAQNLQPQRQPPGLRSTQYRRLRLKPLPAPSDPLAAVPLTMWRPIPCEIATYETSSKLGHAERHQQ